jgi:DNA-binding GntR family transcriptional regulator
MSETKSERMSESKTVQAYHWVRERIEDGRFSPGHRLVLDAIARDLGCSKVPVREAIRMLEAEGLVSTERNVGAQVAFLHEEEYLHTMQTLALVEGSATALSAPCISAEHIARARAINDQMVESLESFDPQRFTQLNQSFHSVLFEQCPNPHILDLVHRGWKRLSVLRDSVFGFVPGRAHESVREHEEILRLLEGADAAIGIELAVRNHRLATLDAVLAYHAEHQNRITSRGVPARPSQERP